MAPTQAAPQDQVIVRRKDCAVHIILNRPDAINSLTLDMIRTIAGTLEKARSDDTVNLVVMSGMGERGFCAGGDIKTVAEAARTRSMQQAMAFFAEEYALDLAIHRYPKPVVVFAHGITMGGGLGLCAGADVVVATETTRMAMPETRIGFFPDIGATGWMFNTCRKPGYPEFLGLTGYEMAGRECVRIGFASCLVPSAVTEEALDKLMGGSLALTGLKKPAGDEVLTLLEPFADKDIPARPEMDRWVEEYFAGKSSVLGILRALRACSTESWLCGGVFERLSERSPSAVVATLRLLRHNEGRELAEVFDTDLGAARYLTALHDFREGVRARLIDKDDRPRWDPDSFEEAMLVVPDLPVA
ncbi:MAG TPA: enoyl-CoA hydratase/isomerase family protein [Deltaproteobacteria bacterium]|nr:enoyl-CoA hydratase/isomerase family protein [Deltaproteobacteria bacterium]HPR54928.1 enoyl-CoA hydratase/isomerase family protein [Deltaproteobacteria bacterium]HXK47761.1 enoyl-CoA hydratase/isomerase family protein [Deltaproteobacteria bacterium]